jgi:hypothetical protein
MYSDPRIKTGDFIFITMTQPVRDFGNIVTTTFTMTNRNTCCLAVWLDMKEYDNNKIVIVPGHQKHSRMFYYHTESFSDYDYISKSVTNEAVLCDLSRNDNENMWLEYRPISNSIPMQHRIDTMYKFIDTYHHRRHLMSRNFLYKLNAVYSTGFSDNEKAQGMCSTFTGLYYDMLTQLEYPWNPNWKGNTKSAFQVIPYDYQTNVLQTPLFKNKVITYYRRGDIPETSWMNIYFIIFVVLCLILSLVIIAIWGGIVYIPRFKSRHLSEYNHKIDNIK